MFMTPTQVTDKQNENIPPVIVQQCTPGMLFWNDAAVYERRALEDEDTKNMDKLLPRIVSIGCIAKTERSYVVIYNISENKPDGFVIIPKEWAMKFQQFQPVPEGVPADQSQEK
jgi:hypothetical protein